MRPMKILVRLREYASESEFTLNLLPKLPKRFFVCFFVCVFFLFVCLFVVVFYVTA